MKTGYTFAGWTEANNPNSGGTDVTVSKGSKGHLVFTANWTALYEITTNVVNGTITPSTTVESGADHTVAFTPNEGFILDSVKVDGKEVTADTEYTFEDIQQDHSIMLYMFVMQKHLQLPDL